MQIRQTFCLLATTAVVALSSTAIAQEAPSIPSEATLFKNVMVFDGVNDGLKDVDVLVVKNKIHKIGKNIPTPGI